MADNLRDWLASLKLEHLADLFEKNQVHLRDLPLLSEEDLKDLGLALGPRKRLLKGAAGLSSASGPPEAETRGPSESAPAQAERRQLTVMFVDLVGSTEMAANLDPEDLRDVIRRYQNTVAGEVVRYEGHVAKFMGDGILVYFGYPETHEDEVERAVRAGLGIVGAVAGETAMGKPLEVRIGLATGQVVVGDLIGEGAAQEEAVIGETPKLAARLQELAAPGWVVVAESTRDLLGGLFEVQEVGAQFLKGFSEPVMCWRVLGERTIESRFEAAQGGPLSHFVGREHELALLEERWSQARDGEGQIVMLTGEAGIGKSRLVGALMERLAGEPHTRLRYQCSLHYANSALHPFITQLERAAGFHPEDGAETKRAKLEALLRQAADDIGEVAPLIASLLSLPEGPDDQGAELDPQRRKHLTLRALLDQLSGLANRQPVLMVFEDAQWADPTSLQLLEQMVAGIEKLRVLGVITGRSEFRPPWTSHSHVTTLTLNRLGRRYGTAIVDGLTGGKAIPEAVLDQIIARTDGVPLFVEELTKTILESGVLNDTGGRYAIAGELPPRAIPSTLQASLTARLDRLASAKEVAQIGAAIGREFPHELIAEVVQKSDDELTRALSQLCESELLFRCGNPPDATYVFKHTLVQETAYGSLLRDKRRTIHQRIASVLAANYPDVAETEPEVLARHYTDGGLVEDAIPYWQRAGKRAAERFADAEAREHLQKSLSLLEHLEDGAERDASELESLLLLGPVLMNLQGSASSEVGQTYRRAWDLCDRIGARARRFPAIWGMWLHHHMAGDTKTALNLAHEAIQLAESLASADFLLQAHHAAWTSHEGVADYRSSREHATKGLALYDVHKHRRHAFTYGGHDPGVCAALQSAVTSWFLGYPEQAREHSEKGLELARLVAHSFSQAHALAFGTLVRLLRREPVQAVQLSEELIQYSTSHGLNLWRANGQILRSWALSDMGKASEVLEDFGAAIREREAAGSQLRLSLYLAAMAHALARAGESAEAHAVIDRAIAHMKQTGERTWEAVILWINGQIVAADPKDDLESAAACYQESYEVAGRLNAKSMELRAATSLANVWSNQGHDDDARNLLAPVYAWFTEGFDTPDLRDARSLLEKLA